MSRTERFRFEFSVSNEFVREAPDAQRWIEARKDEIAKIKSARGPRGGLYRLIGAPDGLVSGQTALDFMRDVTTYATRRLGKYVPPNRVTPDLLLGDSITLTSFTIPVVEGHAMLPDGRVVESESKWIVVPVPPAAWPM